MDWKTFIAEMSKSLAWPVVALIVLLSLRKNLGSFLDSIREVKSGKHSIVTDRLNENRENIQAIKEETPALVKDVAEAAHHGKQALDNLAGFSPRQIVLEAFEPVQTALTAFRELLDISNRSNLIGIAVHLRQRDLIDDYTLTLFRNLYEVRNTVRNDPTAFVSMIQASDFTQQSEVLVTILKNLQEYLQKNPPKNEG